jgi:Pyridoxamine 5'-phosphate oxidase
MAEFEAFWEAWEQLGMAQQFTTMDAKHRSFIERQHIFFVASATADSRVNLSPKDAASLRILNPNRVAYLDQTGSGNETAAHVRAHGRLTMMFCAFAGAPLILRLYGRGTILPRGSAGYAEMLADEFGGIEPPGARQMIVLDVDLVQTSCGYGVPLFDFGDGRTTLLRWAEAKGEEGLAAYWRLNNRKSIDGLPTGILDPAS